MIRNILRLVILLFMVTIIAGLIIPQISIVTSVLRTNANETITDSNRLSRAESVLSSITLILGVFLILFSIGVVTYFVINSNKREREEFQYYENYR